MKPRTIMHAYTVKLRLPEILRANPQIEGEELKEGFTIRIPIHE